MSATTTKLDADSHLLLDESLLRLPHEVLRKTFKTAQKHYEREQSHVMTTIKEAVRSAGSSGVTAAPAALKTLDSLINRMQGYKRKVEALHEEEKTLHGHTRKRIAHLQDLYNIPSLVDPAYETWSKTRLERLLVDLLLRNGFSATAEALAKDKGIEELVDVDVFVQCSNIERSLRDGHSTAECLAWCIENKTSLRKQKSTLEFELRLQQFIELVREEKHKEAMTHSKKFLAPHSDTHFEQIRKAAGLLAILPSTQCPRYKALYSSSRWSFLAETFVKTHHTLYGLPPQPLIHTALSAGLSALKTPFCHSKDARITSNSASSTTSLCPICSTELNELARHVPYAHHGRSSVEPDPVMLPNGRVYGRERIEVLASKLNLKAGMIRDPTTGEDFKACEMQKVYIM